MKRTILFDLDGTLTDPGEGITNSVEYALRKWGISIPDRRALYCFIGPPLKDSFVKYYGFEEAEAEQAIVRYREYFAERGIFENTVYEGIPALLSALAARGDRLILATSKPEQFAKQILKHFALDGYFDYVAGATMDGRVSKKSDVIAKAIADAEIDLSCAVMIGDREHDVLGAKANGLPAIGVLYGYGDRAEHEAAGADWIVETVEDLEELLLSLPDAVIGEKGGKEKGECGYDL